MTDAAGEEYEPRDVVKTSRDPHELRQRLQAWLITRTNDPNTTVGNVHSPDTNGMSSESIFFDAAWNDTKGSFVARLAPLADDVPLFPRYDLEMQHNVIALVAERSTVPVPGLRWLERDASHLDVEFFVMDRVHGRVPSDVPPYATGGWVCDLSPDDQSELERKSLALIAGVHNIDISDGAADFLHLDQPGDTALRRHFNAELAYYEWVCDGAGRRYPTIERAHEWINTNWPSATATGPDVLSWGDSRIGNVMYANDGTDPVAAFDWEMAAIAPRGLDVGWMCFMHQFFEHLLAPFAMTTLPEMFRPEHVREQYYELSGVDVGDLRFERVYNAARHATIMARIHARGVHFGTNEWPDDPDDTFMIRGLIDELISD